MASAAPSPTGEIFSKLSKGTRGVLKRSEQYSARLKKIHMEHLFFALFDKPNGLTRTVFKSKNFIRKDLEQKFREAKFDVPLFQEIEGDLQKLPDMSKHVADALSQAAIFAAQDGKKEITTRYLLLGVVSVADCSVVHIMAELGVTVAYVRSYIYPERYSTLRSASSDSATTEDKLGFRPYVTALAAFLKSDQTRPPLTLSIEGEWGSGKSSFMKQLALALGQDAASINGDRLCSPRFRAVLHNSGHGFHARIQNFGPAWSEWMASKPLFVNFNAWRHDKEEALWAAFALAFTRQALQQQVWPRRIQRRIRLFWKQYDWGKGWLEIARICGVWLLLLAISTTLLLPFVYPGKSNDWRARTAHSLACALSGETTNQGVPCATPDKGLQHGSSSEPGITQAEAAESQKPHGNDTKPIPARGPAEHGDNSSEPKKPTESKDDWTEVLKALIRYGGGLGGLAVAISIWRKLFKLTGNPFETKIKSYLRSPDYDTKISFVERFHEDFRRMVESCVPEDQKVYVFIDDLDRCDVPKAAELMQALNLLISDEPHLVFILGLDRRKVAAGIAVKNKELLPYLYAKNADDKLTPADGLKYGTEFIEKFIQLPFRVPEPTGSEFSALIRQISAEPAVTQPAAADAGQRARKSIVATDSTTSAKSELSASSSQRDVSEDPVEVLRKKVELDLKVTEPAALMIAPTLGNNPRRLKQFINLFRLQYFLCEELGLLEGSERLTAEKIAKFVAISLKWPELLVELPKQPDLLWQLQKVAIGQEKVPANASAFMKSLSGDIALADLLKASIGTRVEKLEKVNFLHLLTVCPTPNTSMPRSHVGD